MKKNNTKQCFACFLCLLCHLCLCFLSKVRCHSCCLAKVVCHYCFLSKVSCHSCICEKGRWAPGWKTLRTRFRQNCIWQNKETLQLFQERKKQQHILYSVYLCTSISQILKVRLPDGFLILDVWPPWGGFLSNSCQRYFLPIVHSSPGMCISVNVDLSQILLLLKPIPFCNGCFCVTVEQNCLQLKATSEVAKEGKNNAFEKNCWTILAVKKWKTFKETNTMHINMNKTAYHPEKDKFGWW